MTEKIYYRIATGNKNQDFFTVVAQISTLEVWGGLAMYGSLFPTVRAFPGKLPDNTDGIEFETEVPPTIGSPRGEVYWKLHPNCNPGIKPAIDGFARIPVKFRKIRYSKEANLGPRFEWSTK